LPKLISQTLPSLQT